MITIEEAVDKVQSQYSKGVRSVDSRLSTRYIYSCLLDARSTLIQQQYNKNQSINSWAYQMLPIVPLSLVEAGACALLKSTLKLPKVISGIDGDLFGRITSSDGEVAFSKGNFENRKYTIGNRYTANTPRAYVDDGYLYITHLKMLNQVILPGYFEDPVEVYQFNAAASGCIGCSLKDYNTLEFPIDRKLLKTAVDMACQQLIILFSQMRQDIRNNSMDDNNETGTMIHQPSYVQDES